MLNDPVMLLESYAESLASPADLLNAIAEVKKWRTKAGLYEMAQEMKQAAMTAPDDAPWRAHADRGDLIPAVREFRTIHGCGLKEARDAVEGYMARGRE